MLFLWSVSIYFIIGIAFTAWISHQIDFIEEILYHCQCEHAIPKSLAYSILMVISFAAWPYIVASMIFTKEQQ